MTIGEVVQIAWMIEEMPEHQRLGWEVNEIRLYIRYYLKGLYQPYTA